MIPHLSERAIILAPQGRDAAVARAMLAEAGLRTETARDVGELLVLLSAGAGFSLITEEALASADMQPLSRWIEAQAEWSDFPFILLTQRGGGLERNPSAGRHLDLLGNVTFLERPFHPTTLISLARSALRGRRRQYEARGRLDELRDLAEVLEQRVEARTAEHEIAVAQLHEAQKLETLGQLTGGVAHDFNNLLTPITGALDMLQRKHGDHDQRTTRLIANALQAADRATTLVQRLLGFARRQTLQTRAVDLAALLGGMRDLVTSAVGPTIEVHLRQDEKLPAALADPNQLELAILNLCVNARDAMPQGGTLTVVTEQLAVGPGQEPKLTPGLYLRLSVIDAGVGMDAETLARAVEPFFSTKETGRGTGLGLSMVHGLAAQLGGAFVLTSAPGQGTRADLYLPVADEVAAGALPTHKLALPTMDRSLTILLIDDEEIVRAATAEMMRDLGHEVIEAAGGAEALGKFAAGLQVDVVVTDYKMPRINGAELSRRLDLIRPGVPILIITGYTGTTDDILKLPRLSKPFAQADLAAALASLFNSGDNVVPLRRH
ncbi:MAG TPA: ATP-binding protein [Allosphingosinicella sp.]|nr:ATP-binding protein [Allosphingosinicella sp.]